MVSGSVGVRRVAAQRGPVVLNEEAFSNRLDGVIYHLDGPGALKHLDRLLELPRLHGIQWTPGTGHPTGLHWLDLYKRIQAKGKAVHVSLAAPEVATAVRELKPEGLFINTGAGSVEEAERVLEDAERAIRERGRRPR
jgi:hypothetical protein